LHESHCCDFARYSCERQQDRFAGKGLKAEPDMRESHTQPPADGDAENLQPTAVKKPRPGRAIGSGTCPASAGGRRASAFPRRRILHAKADAEQADTRRFNTRQANMARANAGQNGTRRNGAALPDLAYRIARPGRIKNIHLRRINTTP